MNLKQKYGNTALVAGASEGIGAAFATRLAAEGMDLVLIARRIQPLLQLADSLENKYKVNVVCIPCDLSGYKCHYNKYEKALNGTEINLLVYNAALSYIGPFIKNSPEPLPCSPGKYDNTSEHGSFVWRKDAHKRERWQ